MPPEAKKVYEENENLLGHMLASPTEVVFSGGYEWLLDANGEHVHYQPEDYMGRYIVCLLYTSLEILSPELLSCPVLTQAESIRVTARAINKNLLLFFIMSAFL